MSMSVGGRKSGAIAEINVTPMADVMIVLLIIFMVMTPIITHAPVPLPKAATAEERKSEGVKVVVLGTGEIMVGEQRLADPASLRESLREQLAAVGQGEAEVVVQADRDLSYAEVSRVLEACRQAGAESVGLAADREIGG
jgi:biopolymer transport protein ExbD